jgi:ribosomal-protein-serine acetyltransferase
VRFDLSDATHLRPVTLRDADALFDVTVANRAHLAPWMPWARDLRHPGQTREWIRTVQRQQAEGNGFSCLVVDDGRIAGTVSLNRVDHVNGATAIGYWLTEAAQGRGTMTAAVRALVGHAFGTMGLHRVVIEAAPDNVRSRAIPERLGFTEEGVLREVERVGDRWLDHVVYGLLAAEWRAAPS